MVDFLIGLAFVAMIMVPVLIATLQRTKTHERDR
jgi:hypothetical protein